MIPSPDLARRSFLQSTVALASLGFGLPDSRAEQATQAPLRTEKARDPRATLELLLERYRRHQRTGLYAGRPAGGNHIPMALTAAWRLGASAEELERYVGVFRLRPEARPLEVPARHALTRTNWEEHLGRASLFEYAAYFERRIEESSPDAVLRESVPVRSEE